MQWHGMTHRTCTTSTMPPNNQTCSVMPANWNQRICYETEPVLSVFVIEHIDGLVQERRNSSVLAMELPLSCTNPSTWSTDALPSYSINKNFHKFMAHRLSTPHSQICQLIGPWGICLKLVNFKLISMVTRYVDGTPTSEVTPVTKRYIHPPHHGYP